MRNHAYQNSLTVLVIIIHVYAFKDESGRWPKKFLMNNFFQTSFIETSDNMLSIYEIKYWGHRTRFFFGTTAYMPYPASAI